MDVTIRGITFPDVDLTDADVVEAWSTGIDAIQAMKRPREGDVRGTAAFIRDLCDTLRDWFDEILGEGAGDSILPRDSMYEGMAAYRELIEAQQQANKETEALWADLEVKDSDQPNNRQQRRAQKRQQQRNKHRRERKAPADPYAPERLEQ